MDHQITFNVASLFFLFLLSGFFSCSEAALFSLTSLHLHKMATERSPFLSYVLSLLKYPRRLLITIIVGNETVNITISVLMASLFIYLLGTEGRWVAIAVTSSLLLILLEGIPKTFGVTRPIQISSFVAPLLMFFSRIERPIVWTLERVSGWFVSLPPRDDARNGGSLMEDEFRTLIDVGQKEGVLEESQRDLIHRVFDLADKPVSEVMVPRVDIFCLPISLSMEELEREIIKTGHTKTPIYGTDKDDIRGILFVRDLVGRISGKRPAHVETLLRKPYFVPLEKSVGSLLLDFQVRKMQIAIVVDEYGGVAGLVTLEDIVEDLFEDIYDEYGVRGNLWERIDDRTLMVSGKLSTDDLNDLMDISIPAEDYETVGGFVFHLFGKLPSPGEEVHFGEGDCIFRVERMGKARILTIRVEKKAEQDE
ncbi:MAG: hemolysin family protein [Syntrophales bacterium]|nr:hemolysin family protein [Syntrophales bacterium]